MTRCRCEVCACRSSTVSWLTPPPHLALAIFFFFTIFQSHSNVEFTIRCCRLGCRAARSVSRSLSFVPGLSEAAAPGPTSSPGPLGPLGAAASSGCGHRAQRWARLPRGSPPGPSLPFHVSLCSFYPWEAAGVSGPAAPLSAGQGSRTTCRATPSRGSRGGGLDTGEGPERGWGCAVSIRRHWGSAQNREALRKFSPTPDTERPPAHNPLQRKEACKHPGCWPHPSAPGATAGRRGAAPPSARSGLARRGESGVGARGWGLSDALQ